MTTILYTSFYREADDARRVEIETCLDNNLLAGFDMIVLFVENNDVEYTKMCLNGKTALIWPVQVRPCFQDYINLANTSNDSCLHVACNADIYWTVEELNKLKELPWEKKKLYVPLSRWDIVTENTIKHLDRPDTADTYCWYNKCEIKNAVCPLGTPGVDNRLAWLFKEAGYITANVSKDIKTYHLHRVKRNNYRQDSNPNNPVIADQICSGSYAFHPPIFISEIP